MSTEASVGVFLNSRASLVAFPLIVSASPPDSSTTLSTQTYLQYETYRSSQLPLARKWISVFTKMFFNQVFNSNYRLQKAVRPTSERRDGQQLSLHETKLCSVFIILFYSHRPPTACDVLKRNGPSWTMHYWRTRKCSHLILVILLFLLLSTWNQTSSLSLFSFTIKACVTADEKSCSIDLVEVISLLYLNVLIPFTLQSLCTWTRLLWYKCDVFWTAGNKNICLQYETVEMMKQLGVKG